MNEIKSPKLMSSKSIAGYVYLVGIDEVSIFNRAVLSVTANTDKDTSVTRYLCVASLNALGLYSHSVMDTPMMS